MTIQPPAPDEPRRPDGPKDPGDAWVVADSGEKYWGRFGAAGLLALDPDRGVLLQHRVSWSHFGGTWGIPGGALHEGESAVDGAIREATEEAGVPEGSVRARLLRTLDLGIWTYGTLVADVVIPFEPVISDPESAALAWVPVDEVENLPLHPGFAAAWPALREVLDVRAAVIVDAANVVGSVPDGWWKDRAGAAERLLARVQAWAADGVSSERLELPDGIWFPHVAVVVEGQARSAGVETDEISIVRAPGVGDDTIAAEAARLVNEGFRTTVVTSDRGLTDRVISAGGAVRTVSWLRDQLPGGR